jgi:hypothetical protein
MRSDPAAEFPRAAPKRAERRIADAGYTSLRPLLIVIMIGLIIVVVAFIIRASLMLVRARR